MPVITANVSEDLYQSLRQACKKLDRSNSYVIRQAIAYYVKSLESDQSKPELNNCKEEIQ